VRPGNPNSIAFTGGDAASNFEFARTNPKLPVFSTNPAPTEPAVNAHTEPTHASKRPAAVANAINEFVQTNLKLSFFSTNPVLSLRVFAPPRRIHTRLAAPRYTGNSHAN
jgi:hypothetical protein